MTTRPRPAHPFETLEQQHQSATLGMWAFLATEVLLFGPLFLGYVVLRWLYPAAFEQASHHLYVTLGTVNTAILLSSSVTMALAVRARSPGRRRATSRLLWTTAALGAVFLTVKGIEYVIDVREGLLPGARFDPSRFTNPVHSQLFLFLYWVMTGVHALHLTIAVGVVAGLAVRTGRGQLLDADSNLVESTGLYWHFVDIVWLYLFPLLYLLGV